MRFYPSLAPRVLITTPLWVLEILLAHMPALVAEESYRRGVVTQVPFMKRSDSYRFFSNLERAIKIAVSTPTIQIIEENKTKAKEWFIAMGAEVE